MLVVDAEIERQLHTTRAMRDEHTQEPATSPLTQDALLLATAATISIPNIDTVTPISKRLYISGHSQDGKVLREPTFGMTAPSTPLGNSCLPPIFGPPPPPSTPTRARMSLYLESRCSLCPAEFHDHPPDPSTPQYYFALDGNFAQKRLQNLDRRKGFEKQEGARDPLVYAPQTAELPRLFVERWEAKREAIVSTEAA